MLSIPRPKKKKKSSKYSNDINIYSAPCMPLELKILNEQGTSFSQEEL